MMDSVNLHIIGVDLDCDVCNQPMADVATLIDREILVHHTACKPEDEDET